MTHLHSKKQPARQPVRRVGRAFSALGLCVSLTLAATPACDALTLGVALTVVATPACDRVTEQTEVQRKKLAEQKLIQAYSVNVARVNILQTAFTDSWKTANEQTNIKDLKEAFDTRVLPALRTYVTALRAMPTESEPLKKSHAGLVGAYDATLAAFEAFSKGLTEDNIIPRHKTLLEATDKVHAAERQYYAGLKEYYGKFNVTLEEPKAKTPEAATPPKPAGEAGPPKGASPVTPGADATK